MTLKLTNHDPAIQYEPGGDVCEVSPPLDPTGHTALTGANLLFEILCVVADAVAQRRP